MAAVTVPFRYSPQETGYWCGPGSTQIALASFGIDVAERTLAGEMFTDQDGTDHIGLVVNVLRARSRAGYIARLMPNDPPTGAQRDHLWRDVVDTVARNRRAMVANWVVPPGGLAFYPWETIFHYVAIVGVDEATHMVCIADPASFGGPESEVYWIHIDKLAQLVPPKGYAYLPAVVVNMIDARRKDAPWLGAAKMSNEGTTRKHAEGRYRHYENGSIYWRPDLGAIPVPALVFQVWSRFDFENGFLGFPTRPHTVIDKVGDIQAFDGGTIYRKYGTEGFVVTGAIRDRWAQLGHEGGVCGWPTDNETDDGRGGRIQKFEHKSLHWHPSGVVLILNKEKS